MYTVYCDGYPLHDPSFNDIDYQLIEPVITEEINKISSFTFSIPATNVNVDKLKTLTSIIEVYDDDRKIFRGRILNSITNWDNTKEVVCESVLAFLNDTVRQPYPGNEYTAEEYLSYLISLHNYRTTTDKMFYKGTVTVTGTLEVQKNDEYPTIWAEIENSLLAQCGGYLFLEEVGDGNEIKYYLNYYADSPYHCTQKIRFGENLLDLSREARGEDIVTRLIPLGARQSNGRRLTISSVNDGYHYIVDDEAEEEYGRIWGVACWDTITKPAKLKTKGQQYLAEKTLPARSMQITAVDLHLMEKTIEDFRCGYYVTIEDNAHGINEEMLITKKVTHLTDASKGTITIGSTNQKISEKYVGSTSKVEQIANYIKESYTTTDGTNETSMEPEGITITDGTNTTTLSAGMGKRVHSNGTEQSLSSGTTLQNLGSFELTRGTWVVSVSARFASNATGRRAVNMSDSSGGSAINAFWGDGSAAVNGAYTYLRMASTVRVTDATHTYYINGYQNSGSALSVVAAYDAVRIF